MKKILLLLALVTLAPCALAASVPQDATALPPARITLYASGASVTETRLLQVVDGVVRFTLPAAVDTQSLRIRADGGTVAGLQVTKIQADPDNGPDAAALRAARQKADELASSVAVLQARLDFWMKADKADKGDITAAEALFTENVETLNRQLQQAETALAASRKDVAGLEERQQARGVSESAFAVTARVLRTDNAAGPLAVQLSYMIGSCGWQPLMRLDALTAQRRIDLERIAVIDQRTGMDWTEVDLTLSTASPSVRVEPPRLGSWRIAPVRAAEPRPAANQAVTLDLLGAAMPAAAAKSSLRALEQAPVFAEEASSESWALGVRNVPAGTPVLVTLDNRQWPTQFVRLIRPARQSVSYLMGQVALPEALHIPAGAAQYFVDGVFAGNGTFDFSGREKAIAFGPDPAVTAVMTADAAQSGTHGIVGRRQSYEWRWTITVKNAHTGPVDVRVEDALPQPGDSGITINIDDSPAAERDGQTLVWNLTVPAGAEKSIRHQVSFEAPADMTVAPGR